MTCLLWVLGSAKRVAHQFHVEYLQLRSTRRMAKSRRGTDGDVQTGSGRIVEDQCNEGHTVTGTPAGVDFFTIACEDGQRQASQCEPVSCGAAPAASYAVSESIVGQAFTSGQEVIYTCPQGYHVGSHRSRIFFLRACLVNGTFDNALNENRTTCGFPPDVQNSTLVKDRRLWSCGRRPLCARSHH